GGSPAEIEIERVQRRDAGVVARERIRVPLIFREELRKNVRAAVVDGAGRPHALLRSEEAEFGERRRLELVVREEIDPLRMIDGNQLYLIEVRNFAQFFGHANFVTRLRR